MFCIPLCNMFVLFQELQFPMPAMKSGKKVHQMGGKKVHWMREVQIVSKINVWGTKRLHFVKCLLITIIFPLVVTMMGSVPISVQLPESTALLTPILWPMWPVEVSHMVPVEWLGKLHSKNQVQDPGEGATVAVLVRCRTESK